MSSLHFCFFVIGVVALFLLGSLISKIYEDSLSPFEKGKKQTELFLLSAEGKQLVEWEKHGDGEFEAQPMPEYDDEVIMYYLGEVSDVLCSFLLPAERYQLWSEKLIQMLNSDEEMWRVWEKKLSYFAFGFFRSYVTEEKTEGAGKNFRYQNLSAFAGLLIPVIKDRYGPGFAGKIFKSWHSSR